jgi:hypothetical protein
MAEVIVNAVTWTASDEVGKNEPIRRDQLGGHVDVKVPEAGCYAVRVELVQHNLADFDHILGTNADGTDLKCWCFKADESRHFKYHGAGGPAGGTVRYDESDREELDAVHGTWPPYAGVFDDVLTPYIQASVFRCPKPCDESGNCASCPVGSLGTSLKDDKTSDHRMKIYNGEGVAHGVNVVSSIGSALESLFGKLLGG